MPLKRMQILRILCVPALAAGAAANAAEPALPAAFSRVVDCRSIADQAQRLSCYDREVAQLQAAQARDEIVIVDRNQIRQTKRTLFGLALPNLAIFGDSDKDDEGVSRLETTVARAQETADGQWLLTLEEGGTWIQTDSRELVVDPRPGSPIIIRRAAFGSYLARVEDQPGIRVKRIQ